MAFSATFLMVGCAGGGSQGQEGGHEDHTTHHQGTNVKLTLHPEHNSGVSGTASFEDTPDGVLVKLNVRNLPKPTTLYLAHIHPGSCAQVAEEGQTHAEHGEEHQHGQHHEEEGGGQGHSGHEHGTTKEIEYPLTQVKSDSEGHGSSTTTLGETSVEKLFSGAPKYVNVHKAGGSPPILSCANLRRTG